MSVEAQNSLIMFISYSLSLIYQFSAAWEMKNAYVCAHTYSSSPVIREGHTNSYIEEKYTHLPLVHCRQAIKDTPAGWYNNIPPSKSQYDEPTVSMMESMCRQMVVR